MVSSVSGHSTTPQAVRAHGPGSGGQSNASADQSPLLLVITPTGIAHTCAAMTPLRRPVTAGPPACGAAGVDDRAPLTSPPSARRPRRLRQRYYFADEARICSDYHSGTAWALVGQTPVVASTGARYAVNVISASTSEGGAVVLRLHRHPGRRPDYRLLPPAAPRRPRTGQGVVQHAACTRPCLRMSSSSFCSLASRGNSSVAGVYGQAGAASVGSVWQDRQSMDRARPRLTQCTGSGLRSKRGRARAEEPDSDPSADRPNRRRAVGCGAAHRGQAARDGVRHRAARAGRVRRQAPKGRRRRLRRV
jgi:hypothetical protein